MFQMISEGWSPFCLSSSPVVWQRREYNKIADYIVNNTMDRKTSWQQVFEPPLADFTPLEANFICHSDGGTRAASCSAAGWFLEAVVIRGELRYTFPVAMHGQFFNEPISSFLAEAIAVDEAIAYFPKLVSGL